MLKDATQRPLPSSGPRFETVGPRESSHALGWNTQADALSECLTGLCVTSDQHHAVDCDEAFDLWCEAAEEVRQADRVIYLIGNGASSSMASHYAADLAKNADLHTQVFTDTSLMTAIANDIAFDMVFVVPLERRLRPGDMVVAISSSGNSPNVVKAAEFAVSRNATLVTLTAMQPTNTLRQLGTLNFWLPADTYGMAETGHAAILHYWMDQVSLQH